jgi:ComEC/Rec2-related protein
MEELRRELGHRPLVLAAVALCIGLSARLFPVNLIFLVPLLAARRPWPVAIALLLGIALSPKPAALLTPSWLKGQATVVGVPFLTKGGLAADVVIDGKKVRAILPAATVISRGDVWQMEGKANPLSEASEALSWKGISGRFKPILMVKVADGAWPWRAADAWRRSFEQFSQANLPPEEARWLNAFTFRFYALEDEEMDALKGTGTIHLIAASGLHVAALGTFGLWLGLLTGLPRQWVLGLLAVLVLFYAMATGLHLPTVRATIAFVVGSSAYLVRREPDGLSALALAVLVYLPFDPSAVFDIGFQLSITVVGFFVLWPKRRREPARTAWAWGKAHVRDLVAASLVATLAAAPILARYEGSFAPLSLPANLFAIPPVLIAIFMALVLHPLHVGWAMPVVAGLVSAAVGVIEAAGAIPSAVVQVPPFSPYLLALIYLPWMAFWRPRARPAD